MTLPDIMREEEGMPVDAAGQAKRREMRETRSTRTRRAKTGSGLNTAAAKDPVHPAMRIYAAFRSTVMTVGAIIGVASILTFGVSLLFGVRPLVVVSGSMEPTIPVGAVVFTAQTPAGDIKDGTIVTVDRPRNLGLVTHRLIKSVETEPGTYEYTLKGDANSKDDPEPYKVKTAGKYVWHVVGLGYLAEFLQSRNGMIVGIGCGLALFALFIADPDRIASRRSKRNEEADPEGAEHATQQESHGTHS